MTAVRLLLASGNEGKVAEFRRLLAGLDVELLGLGDAPAYRPGPETGLTFRENALLKAREAVAATGLVSVADDSGLCVDALNGMPGVLSARWCGRHGNDRANTELLLAQLADVPDERLSAHFACAAALVTPGGEEHVVEGRMTGVLTRAPRGTGGFGYDPVFVPAGHDRTSAELSPAEKDAISHRGAALRALVPVVRELVEQSRSAAQPVTGAAGRPPSA